MSVIYLEHPVHGNKVACSEEEATYDEKHGWKRYTLADTKAPAAPPATPVVRNALAVDALTDEERAAYKAKYGRAPHHKKSPLTIRAELAAMGEFANR